MNAVWSAGLLLAVGAVLLAGCARPRPIEAPPGVQISPLRTISILEARVLLALKLLQDRGTPVLGAAPVAAPVDLTHISLPAAMRGGSASHALYLAYAAWGQAAWYGHPLDSVLNANQARIVDRLFSGAKPKEILAALPAEPRRLFSPAFLEAYDHGGAHWYLDAFAAADLTDMTPKAPVRLYYGSKDTDVLPDEALTAQRLWRAKGADVIAVDVGPVGHDPSMLAAAPHIFAWLRELEAAR